MFESDANGITLVTVAVYSVLRNADPEKPIRVLMAHDDTFLEAGGKEKLEAVIRRFPSATVEFANFMPLYRPLAAKMELAGTRWPPMVWGWVFAPTLFPSVTGKLVYIDLDTYTTGDLQELFELDLKRGRHLLAMVAESRRPEGRFCQVDWWTKDMALYNTGVVVMDADQWRAEGVTMKIVDWFAAHKADVPFVEQDAANYICQDRILRLPLKWNTNDNNLKLLEEVDPRGVRLFAGLHPAREALEAMVEPKIIHYMFTHKPHRYNHRPERNRFREAMIELGLIRFALPGENLFRLLEGWMYDLKYARMKRRARKLWERMA